MGRLGSMGWGIKGGRGCKGILRRGEVGARGRGLHGHLEIGCHKVGRQGMGGGAGASWEGHLGVGHPTHGPTPQHPIHAARTPSPPNHEDASCVQIYVPWAFALPASGFPVVPPHLQISVGILNH